MFLEVSAIPDADAPARLGERFTPRPGAPLRIGPSRDARIRLQGLGSDLLVAHDESRLLLRVPPSSVRASLSGMVLSGGAEYVLRDGDTLSIHPGLALCARDRPPVHVREPHLEARLFAIDDDAAWDVYGDYLEEHGDPLAAWIRVGRTADAAARLRHLGPLADAVRGGLVNVTFGRRGFLESVQVSRQAVVGAPGLRWHLTQLRSLPVARFLRELGVALFAGAAPARVDDVRNPDAAAVDVLERLHGADFLPGLRKLSLGFVQEARVWPRARTAFEHLRAAAPHLEHDFDLVIRTQGKAWLAMVAHPPDVTVLSTRVVLNPGRTDVGAGPGCLVRLVGDAPPVVCTLHRLTDGGWVVHDERADLFSRNPGALSLKVNGLGVARAALNAGDTVEPLPGLVFRFGYG
ncbi:MAG: hypothetical protein AB1938_15075 [Myxococcota bacterium]